MPDEASEPNKPQNDTPSGNSLDKLKQFFTMGGDKNKWTKALIISGVVVLIMGLGATAAWGTAIAFWIRSIGDPNGNSAQACFDKTFSDNWAITGPDPSKAVRSETRKFYVTSYCPPETGSDFTEGGQTTESGIHVGLGSVSVPPLSNRSNPVITGSTPDYPRGTAFEIPGYGTGWAMDHGCAIQKAGVENTCVTDHNKYPPTPNDHLDIFVGNGQSACAKWPTQTALEVKVSWFDQRDYPQANPAKYLKAVKTDSTYGGSGTCPSKNNLGPLVMYQPNMYTAAQIDNYLKTKAPTSPLNGKGNIFVSAGQKYGVNPGFVLGIANAETSLGMQNLVSTSPLYGTNNIGGLRKNNAFIRYSSYDEGIDSATANVAAPIYKHLDGTIREFRLKWCGYETENEKSGIKLSDGSVITYACGNGASNWIDEVTSVMKAL